jgi:hypothetical protein
MTKLWAERLTAFGMIAVAAFFIFESTGLPSSSGAFPKFTEYLIIGLALIMILRTFIAKDDKFSDQVPFDFSYVGMKPTLVMIVSVFYIYAVFQVGFYAASIVFYFLVTFMTGIRNYKVMGAVAVCLFPLMYVFFNIALGADLPKGFLI